MIDYIPILGRLNKIQLLRRWYSQKKTGKTDLHFRQLPLLEYIRDNTNCTQIELAQVLKVSPSAVAISTKRLQALGLLEKQIDEDNLRCKRLRITEDGKRAISQTRETFRELDEKMLSGFTQEEVNTLCGYLDRLAINISGESENDVSREAIDILIAKTHPHNHHHIKM